MSSTVSADVLREHLLYSAWASRRLVHAIEPLSREELERDFGTSEHSIPGTLGHVYAADRIWLARVTGESLEGFRRDAGNHPRVLRDEWPALYQRWNAWAAGLTDESVSTPIAYRDLEGNPWTSAAWEIVLHLVNHGTHHRGQVSGFLRALGRTPPPLDLIAYYREIRK